MGYIPSEENESEKENKEISLEDLEKEINGWDEEGDSPIEIGRQIHEQAERIYHPPFQYPAQLTTDDEGRSCITFRWETIKNRVRWYPPKTYFCSVCGITLTTVYPKGYPNEWAICCFCFVAWNEVNKSSSYKWWRIIGRLRARIYYLRRRYRFNTKLRLKND